MTTLEKIRAEIDEQTEIHSDGEFYIKNFDVKRIIDKYAEQEPSEDNRLYIKVYADLEPQEKAEKLYQICEEEELLEVYKELGEYCDKEPCDDAISRQAVLDLIEHYNSDGLGSVFYGYEEGVKFANAVNELPSVRPQEQTGEWQQDLDGTYLCSECGSGFEEQPTIMGKPTFLWCPLCGARMVEPQESETWHGIHAQITAPKGTFERIFNEADDDNDI